MFGENVRYGQGVNFTNMLQLASLNVEEHNAFLEKSEQNLKYFMRFFFLI